MRSTITVLKLLKSYAKKPLPENPNIFRAFGHFDAVLFDEVIDGQQEIYEKTGPSVQSFEELTLCLLDIAEQDNKGTFFSNKKGLLDPRKHGDLPLCILTLAQTRPNTDSPTDYNLVEALDIFPRSLVDFLSKQAKKSGKIKMNAYYTLGCTDVVLFFRTDCYANVYSFVQHLYNDCKIVTSYSVAAISTAFNPDTHAKVDGKLLRLNNPQNMEVSLRIVYSHKTNPSFTLKKIVEKLQQEQINFWYPTATFGTHQTLFLFQEGYRVLRLFIKNDGMFQPSSDFFKENFHMTRTSVRFITEETALSCDRSVRCDLEIPTFEEVEETSALIDAYDALAETWRKMPSDYHNTALTDYSLLLRSTLLQHNDFFVVLAHQKQTCINRETWLYLRPSLKALTRMIVHCEWWLKQGLLYELNLFESVDKCFWRAHNSILDTKQTFIVFSIFSDIMKKFDVLIRRFHDERLNTQLLGELYDLAVRIDYFENTTKYVGMDALFHALSICYDAFEEHRHKTLNENLITFLDNYLAPRSLSAAKSTLLSALMDYAIKAGQKAGLNLYEPKNNALLSVVRMAGVFPDEAACMVFQQALSFHMVVLSRRARKKLELQLNRFRGWFLESTEYLRKELDTKLAQANNSYCDYLEQQAIYYQIISSMNIDRLKVDYERKRITKLSIKDTTVETLEAHLRFLDSVERIPFDYTYYYDACLSQIHEVIVIIGRHVHEMVHLQRAFLEERGLFQCEVTATARLSIGYHVYAREVAKLLQKTENEYCGEQGNQYAFLVTFSITQNAPEANKRFAHLPTLNDENRCIDAFVNIQIAQTKVLDVVGNTISIVHEIAHTVGYRNKHRRAMAVINALCSWLSHNFLRDIKCWKPDETSQQRLVEMFLEDKNAEIKDMLHIRRKSLTDRLYACVMEVYENIIFPSSKSYSDNLSALVNAAVREMLLCTTPALVDNDEVKDYLKNGFDFPKKVVEENAEILKEIYELFEQWYTSLRPQQLIERKINPLILPELALLGITFAMDTHESIIRSIGELTIAFSQVLSYQFERVTSLEGLRLKDEVLYRDSRQSEDHGWPMSFASLTQIMLDSCAEAYCDCITIRLLRLDFESYLHNMFCGEGWLDDVGYLRFALVVKKMFPGVDLKTKTSIIHYEHDLVEDAYYAVFDHLYGYIDDIFDGKMFNLLDPDRLPAALDILDIYQCAETLRREELEVPCRPHC